MTSLCDDCGRPAEDWKVHFLGVIGVPPRVRRGSGDKIKVSYQLAGEISPLNWSRMRWYLYVGFGVIDWISLYTSYETLCRIQSRVPDHDMYNRG